MQSFLLLFNHIHLNRMKRRDTDLRNESIADFNFKFINQSEENNF